MITEKPVSPCGRKELTRLVLDVVCGMEIDEKTAKWKSQYKSKTYYFCGLMCKLEFDENPEKYMSDAHSTLDK